MNWFSREHISRIAVCLAAFGAGAVASLLPAGALAVILGSTQGNLTPPPDDPGFANVSDSGSSMVYLGDSWVLTAAHVGVPETVSFADRAYDVIPNTDVHLRNPGGMDLTEDADLRMFRINGNPDLPSIPISASPPPIGAQVTMIGRGRRREDSRTQWNVQVNGDTWDWSETPGSGEYRGFKIPENTERETRWGTNRIANEDPVVGEKDADHNTVVEIGSGVHKRHIVTLLTLWDEFGGTPYEAQAVAGDSGGGVFYKRNGVWELAGIMNAVLTYPGQSGGWAIYGQATAFADLSTYHDEIRSIRDQVNYSIVGDINLDGVVRGDGSGSPDSDDLTAFVTGWLTQHPAADIDSWKLGDLNQDAITDLYDFRLLRTAHPAAAEVAPALGVAAAGIPEPTTAALLVIGGFAAWGLIRRRIGGAAREP